MGASSKVCESGASKYGLPGKVWGPMGKYGRLAQPSMPLVKYGSLSQWGGRCWASNLSSTRPYCSHTPGRADFPAIFFHIFIAPYCSHIRPAQNYELEMFLKNYVTMYKGLSIYYVIRDGGEGSSRFITILHRGGSPQFITILHRGGSSKFISILQIWLEYERA